MKTMKHGTARLVSMLLTLTMVLGLLPASAFAVETPAQTVTVQVNFDYRSVGSEAMLTDVGLDLPQNASAEVPAGSTVYEALEAARAEGAFKPTYGPGFGGEENGFISAFNGLGDIKTLCDSLGAAYADTYQYAGWLYTVNGVDGMGIQSDKVTEDTTISFRYSVYSYWDDANGSMVYVDWAFVDAFDGLNADLAALESLDKTAYTEAQWARVESAAAAARDALAAADPDGLAASGLMLNYITEKGTALWGSGSPTDALVKARQELSRAVGKVVTPEKITVPSGLELTVGRDYQLTPVVLPEGASQAVTYDVLVGADAFTVTENGLVTPTKEASMCMIQIKSVENPSVVANLMFKIKAFQPVTDEKVEAMMNTIAASFVDASDEWTVMDMGAYQLYNPQGVKLDKAALQEYVNYALPTLLGSAPDEASVFKAILALHSQGVDPAALTPFGSSETINAYELLAGMEHSTSLWKAPYTLMAFHLADPSHKLYKEQAQPLLASLLKSQKDTGAWSEFGTVDTTANAITALALYTEVEGVSAAIDKGLNYLSSIQDENGVFGKDPGSMWGTPNANSSAMALIALAAAGVDIAHDARFIKNGHTALDGLMTFALADGSGFGYTDNEYENAMATEQAFRALVPALASMKSGKAVNIHDSSAVEVKPGAADGRTFEVNEYLDGDAATITIPNVSENLVPMVDGKLVKKFDYVNGDLKLILDQDCTVVLAERRQQESFGDVAADAWYAGYVDFAALRGLVAGVGVNLFAPELGLTRAQAVTLLYNLEEGVAKTEAPFTDVTEGWYMAPVAWAAENGVSAGVGGSLFAPENEITRQELAQLMFNYAKALGLDVSVKGDLKDFDDADTAAPWAVEALTWAVENQIMVGNEQGSLMPSAGVTRAEAAAMLNNLVPAMLSALEY